MKAGVRSPAAAPLDARSGVGGAAADRRRTGLEEWIDPLATAGRRVVAEWRKSDDPCEG